MPVRGLVQGCFYLEKYPNLRSVGQKGLECLYSRHWDRFWLGQIVLPWIGFHPNGKMQRIKIKGGFKTKPPKPPGTLLTEEWNIFHMVTTSQEREHAKRLKLIL